MNSPIDRPYRLLAPGPVPVPPKILSQMAAKVIHHRTPEFEAILREAWDGLRYVYQTAQPVQIICGTGSAAMEAAVVNLLRPGDEVVVIVSGKFGERWADMTERLGAVTNRLVVPWGEAVTPAALTKVLTQHPATKMVFTQAVETSTATVHPVRDLVVAARSFNPRILVAVDAITAVGCMPLAMDEDDIDVMVAGSQKAFMIPTGLGFIALSERAWRAAQDNGSRSTYFDLSAERTANERGETLYSTPTPLVVGLRGVLAKIRERGRNCLIHRCEALAEATRAAGQALGLPIFSASPAPSVTALRVPNGVVLRNRLERDFNITVMGGQDQLKGKILRVGHMGDVRNEDVVALFEAIAVLIDRPDASAKVTADLKAMLAQAPPLF